MAITRVGIHYSASQQVIRQIHHFDRIVDPITGKWRLMTAEEVASAHEEKLIFHQQRKTKDGEVFTTLPHADYHAIISHQDIHTYLGLSGISGVTDRHAVVNKAGNVVAIVHADPALDEYFLDINGKIVQPKIMTDQSNSLQSDAFFRFNPDVHEKALLYPHPTAMVGDQIIKGVFTAIVSTPEDSMVDSPPIEA